MDSCVMQGNLIAGLSSGIFIQSTLLFAKYKSPCATLFRGTLELGRHLEVLCSTRCIFLSVNLYVKFQKGKLITHADSVNQKQW